MENKKLIPLREAMEKLQLSRTCIDLKVKAGIFNKYTLPNSNRVYLDENEIAKAFIPKQ